MTTASTRNGLTLTVDPRTGRAKILTDTASIQTRKVAYLPYRSKWEHTFAAHLKQLVIAKQITWWAYEPVTLRLAPRLRYTPDFLVEHVPDDPLEAHRLVFYEVKGWSKNRREGIAKLKMAAQVCPWASFVLVEYRGGQMQCTMIPMR